MYLASEDNQISISYHFLFAQSTVSAVVLDTCQVLWDKLRHDVFRPHSEEMWRGVADGFLQNWQFPNCIAALDGRDCGLQVSSDTSYEH